MSAVSLRQLRDCLHPVAKWNLNAHEADDFFTYIDISAVDQKAKKVREPQIVLIQEAPSRARQIVRAGDVLVSTVRPNLNAVASVPDELDGAIASTGFTVLRPQAKVLNHRYLYHWTRTKEFILYLVSRATGASYPAVSDSIVKDAIIPLPSIADQRRIAAILDKGDDIRRKREQALVLAGNFLYSIFLEMFGDFSKNTKNWSLVSLGSLLRQGPQNGLYRPSSDYGSGTPIVRIDSFYDGKIHNIATLKRLRIDQEAIECYRLNKGDVLINRVNSRSHLGKCALVPDLLEPTVYESNMMRCAVDKNVILPEYLVRVLQTPFLKEQILRRAKDSVNQSSINQGDVISFRIPVPPIEQQKKFVDIERKLSASIDLLQPALIHAEALFASLSQRAFRGDL